MLALTVKQIDSAVDDLRTGISSWRLSHFLAWQDIKQRYRRSTLGPIWMTLSFAVQIFTMGVLSSFLLGAELSKSLPYVCAGMLLWSFITQVITDGANLYVSASRYITQLKCPLTVFLLQTVWRNVIIAGHNASVYLIIAAAFVIVPGAGIMWLPLGLLLVMICVSWMALVIAIVSARYRDVPLLIANVLAIMFWFTPLMYTPEQLGSKRFIADYNPFTHIAALVREPLLGSSPSLNDWLVVLSMTVLGWAGTFLFFARYRSRIVYWL